MASNQGQPDNTEKLRIAVIGGSIAGCIAARLLIQAGHDVHIFEGSHDGLAGRGGGLATSRTVLHTMRDYGLLDADFAAIHHSRLRLAKRTTDHPMAGRSPWSPEIDMMCVNWGGLFSALRQPIPNERYFLGKELVEATVISDREPQGNSVWLDFSDGSTQLVDLVVFADGFRSQGRRLMYPEVDVQYAGYGLWRGLLDEHQDNPGSALIGHPRIFYADMDGSFISYLIPGNRNETCRGQRMINWAAYLPAPPEELVMQSASVAGAVRQPGERSSGILEPEVEKALKTLMRRQLPDMFADIVDATTNTLFQPIWVVQAPGHYRRHMCLIGDAAATIQPMTGSGLFKAFENSRTLVEALRTTPVCSALAPMLRDTALREWSDRQTHLDQRLMTTGRTMEDAFIWNTIDLGTARAADVEVWWNEQIDNQSEYSYLRRPVVRQDEPELAGVEGS